MGMGGGGKQTTSESKTVSLPKWVEAAGEENYRRAQGIANQEFDPYTGKRIADLTPEFYRAKGLLGNLDDYMGNYKSATGYLNEVGRYDPTKIDPSTYMAAQFAGSDINPYLNPYIENVEKRAIDNATRAGQIKQRDLAAGAPARGGSREAVRAAVQEAETTRGIGDLSAQLRKEGYDTATGLAMKDIAARNEQMAKVGDWRQQAAIESERNQLAANEAKIRAASGLSDVADAGQQARINELLQTLGISTIEQQQNQRLLDEKVRQHGERRDWELENLNILLSTLGLTPYGHTETGVSTTKSGGGGGGFGDIMNMVMGGAKMFAGFSDREAKTNVELLDDSGPVPIYAYDYKADVKAAKRAKRAMPMKRVGPMAQDIEKVAPQLVRKVGHKRIIDLSGI
jgi:hypothetical protein